MTNELKPCPFCGGKAKLRKQNRTIIEHQTQRNCYVYCTECDGRGKRYLEGYTQEEHIIARQLAVESWNRRVGSSPYQKGGKEYVLQDTVPFDFDLYQAGLMDMPKGMIEVLEQIRAEIYEELKNDEGESYGLGIALGIIDKHISGKEQNESKTDS